MHRWLITFQSESRFPWGKSLILRCNKGRGRKTADLFR